MTKPKGSLVHDAVATALRGAILAYQYTVSPLLGPRCRFLPSCSRYAMQAIDMHGPLRGTGLALRRLCRCHPWHPGGIDEVPLAAGASRAPMNPSAHER